MSEAKLESLQKKRNRHVIAFNDDFGGLPCSEKRLATSPIDLRNVLHEIKNRHSFRGWLAQNHSKETECWVFVKRGTSKDKTTLWYLDAIEEALCFGWIDSVVKNVPGIGLVQRISPRKKDSHWSELNKERCRRLEKLGLMTAAGRAVLPDMSEESFVIDPDVLEALQSEPLIWENFQKLPKLYQRVRIDYIQRTKRNEKTYELRLKNFIEKTRQNVMFGEWNDNGRLLDY